MIKVVITTILIAFISSVQDGTKVQTGRPRILELKDSQGRLHYYEEWCDSLKVQENLWCMYHWEYENVTIKYFI